MEHFNQLIQEHFGLLSANELSLLRSYFEEKTLGRNEYFTRPGKLCDRLSIVTTGILRVYALSDGKEITQWISTENFPMTAEERYRQYFRQHSALFNQVPLQYIASVLGMTPETFSRIRKKLAGNS